MPSAKSLPSTPPPPSSSSRSEPKPPLWKIWFVASRPHTLPVSLAPNIVAYHYGFVYLKHSTAGSVLGDHESVSYLRLVLEWTVFCVLMQLGTNLHNDYADFVKGADNEKRVGQARATQKGWLTPVQTATASGATLLVGLVLGISFIARMARVEKDHYGFVGDSGPPTEPVLPQKPRMLFTAAIVASSIFNAFAYTGGPWPLGRIGLPNFSLGYSGLGDLFVFLYFGLVATLVPPFLYVACNTNTLRSGHFVASFVGFLFRPAVQLAALATNIIAVNNLRDRHTDVLADKRTLAVRFGAGFCLAEYAFNLLVAYGPVFWNCVFRNNGDGVSGLVVAALPLLSLPLALKEYRAVCTKKGGGLNPHVGGAARVQLVFCCLLALSIRLQG